MLLDSRLNSYQKVVSPYFLYQMSVSYQYWRSLSFQILDYDQARLGERKRVNSGQVFLGCHLFGGRPSMVMMLKRPREDDDEEGEEE